MTGRLRRLVRWLGFGRGRSQRSSRWPLRQSDLLAAAAPSETLNFGAVSSTPCRGTLIYTALSRRYMPGALTSQSHPRAVARLTETGFAAGFAVLACAGAESHPPAGLATLMASSGCGSGVKVWIASLAAASDWAP